ncbi:MAG: hypothetical protein JWM80_2362 [Cyanobacteria bacterium RYN_339]|nr:hypothetical protein [Cyanobacteria bacterium RYN_339]
MDLKEAERLLDGADPTVGAAALRALAEGGQPRAMLQLANRLWTGRAFAKDAREGEAWLRRAVALADPRAMLSLGQRLLYGMGLPSDPAEGEVWLARAAEAGFAPAQQAYAEHLFESGRDGAAWLERAAEAEHPPAMAAWGEFTHDDGWLERAAARGSGRAMGLLGERNPDPVQARPLLAAALARGEVHFGLVLGLAHYQAGEYAEAVQVFERCRTMGAPGAAVNLAYMARRNEWPAEVPRPDPLALLADLTDAQARINRALCQPARAREHLQGVGPQDLGWWQALAARGDNEGQQVVSWLST